MLRHLRVTNFAILSDVSLELGDGLTVLTGETGAGKSLIVDAVNLLRGGRASADIPRAGADEAVVEAIFEAPADLAARVTTWLADSGLPAGDELLVRRVIHRGGRSRTYVNGALTTAGKLAELGAVLVDLSGQHEHQGLVDPGRHLAILDAFAGAAEPVLAMATSFDALRAVDDELAALAGDDVRRGERADYLRFQLDELRAAAPSPGEDVELGKARTRLAASAKLEEGARRAEELLYGGDGSAIEQLDRAAAELAKLTAIDDRLGPPGAQLGEARALLDDAAAALRGYLGHQGGDPARLAEVEDRLDLLVRLKRKHGGSLDDVIARQAELARELDGLDRRDERLAELGARRGKLEATARAAAAALAKVRREAAGRLGAEVAASLAALGMATARLEIRVRERPLGRDGHDHVEFMLAANRGEDEKPLAKIASGGELSRIMLALKLALRRADAVATYVFDEVDAGIGGATAEVVGAKIAALAGQRQVLCVTHLPQIAAFADHHFSVHKTELGGRTETFVRKLDKGEREAEVARMVGGVVVTAEARAHARTLIEGAKRPTRAARAKPEARPERPNRPRAR